MKGKINQTCIDVYVCIRLKLTFRSLLSLMLTDGLCWVHMRSEIGAFVFVFFRSDPAFGVEIIRFALNPITFFAQG